MEQRRNSRPARSAVLGVFLTLILVAPLAATAQDQGSEPASAPSEDQTAEVGEAAAAQEEEVPTRSLTGTLELLVNPVFPPEQARLVYQPLVDYLNDVTDLQVELRVSRNFHRYWLNARRNEAPALILEDAHMVAWRMNRFGYEPLVTTTDTKTFSLLTTGALADDDLQDFVGRRIASLPSPSLGYLVLADWFSNPLQQPLIQSTATSWLDAVEMVFSAESDAAIAPDTLVTKYPNLYPIETSPEFPGLTLIAAPDVPEDVRTELIEALVQLEENPDHSAALFELDIPGFTEADPDDFAGLQEWLSTIFAL